VYQDRPALPLPRQEHSAGKAGAYPQAGASGKEAAEAGRANAEAGRAQAENAARVALTHLDPAAATEVMKLL
jgi:hypothetical protein